MPLSCFTLCFFIRTSNFGVEAERSHIFLRFETENELKMFLNYISGIIGGPHNVAV